MKEMLVAFFIVLLVSAAWKWPQDQPLDIQPSSAAVTENPAENPLISSATEHTFKDQVLQSPMPVLVEFYSDNDAKCRNMDPIISELATDYQASLKVVKVDSANNPQLVQKYEVGYLPGILIFRNGRMMQSVAGEITKADLSELIQRTVPPPPHGG